MLPSRIWIIASLLTAVAVSHEARAQCAPNKPTELASICAVGWKYDPKESTSDNFNPWPAHCEYDDPAQGFSGDTSQAQVINREVCGGPIQVTQVLSADHMAEVSCGLPGVGRLRVNLDSLQCSDTNTHSQAETRRAALGPSTCPPSDPEESRFRQFAESEPDHLLTEVEKKRYDLYKEEIISTQRHINEDLQRLISMPYDLAQSAPDDLVQRVMNASKELKAFQKTVTRKGKYGPDCDEPFDPQSADIIRAQKVCRSINAAVEKADYFLEGGTTQELVSRVSSYFVSHGAGADLLAARTVFFYSLTSKERAEMLRKKELYYVRDVPADELPGTPSFKELGDGYVFGGDRLGAASGHGQDCSSFSVTRDSIEGGMDSPPTRVLKNIAKMLQGDKSVTLRDLGGWAPFRHCFDAVDLRKGEKPRTLDLVVSATDKPAHGHVTVVESYDASRGEIVDMESKGGHTGTTTRCIRPMFERPCANVPASNPGPGIDPPPARPDLYVLRFKEAGAPGSEGCPIRLK